MVPQPTVNNFAAESAKKSFSKLLQSGKFPSGRIFQSNSLVRAVIYERVHKISFAASFMPVNHGRKSATTHHLSRPAQR
jgi:hypothetical protein